MGRLVTCDSRSLSGREFSGEILSSLLRHATLQGQKRSESRDREAVTYALLLLYHGSWRLGARLQGDP